MEASKDFGVFSIEFTMTDLALNNFLGVHTLFSIQVWGTKCGGQSFHMPVELNKIYLFLTVSFSDEYININQKWV